MGTHRIRHSNGIWGKTVTPERVGTDQDRGRVMIGRPADHHAVKAGIKKPARLFQGGDAAVDADEQIGKLLLHSDNKVVVQRRYLAVFLGAEALQPGLAGVDDNVAHPCPGDGLDESGQDFPGRLVVYPDAALNADRHIRLIHHRAQAGGHEVGAFHQHGTKAARLDTIRRTAAVEVDFIISPGTRYSNGLREFLRIGPAKLKSDGMLLR